MDQTAGSPNPPNYENTWTQTALRDHTSTQQMDTTTATDRMPITTDKSQKKTGGFGRGRPKLIRNGQKSGSLGGSPAQSNQSKNGMSPLTITAENMTTTERDRIIEDAKKANKELHTSKTQTVR